MSGFVDLHLHLLPGIDDGSKSMADTLEMANALKNLGYSTLAPSPHFRREFASFERSLCVAKLDETKHALGEAGFTFELHPNAENFFLEESLFTSLGTPEARHLGEGKVLLVEAPYQGPLPRLNDVIFRMKLKGITPLIAHPERCFEFEKKGRAAELVQAGALLQLDMGALIGRYGKTAEKLARTFLDDGLYAIAATDLHSPVGAEKWVGDSLKALEKSVGSKVFADMVRHRPEKLLSGVVE
ncbi:MAG: tyrosine-protein phosphatase [Archangium sp.]